MTAGPASPHSLPADQRLPRLVPRALRVDPDLLDPALPAWLRRVQAARVAAPEELDLSLGALPPPDALLGIENAAALLARALDGRWRILVVGDFDADGATSTALAVLALRAWGH